MKKQIVISALVLGLASVAQAFTPAQTVYITGATSFRGEVYRTLSNNIAKPTDGSTWYIKTEKDNAYTFQGTYHGVAVRVYCSYSGSGTGIGTLVGAPGSTYQPTYLEMDGSSSSFHGASIAFSDVKQSSTPFAAANGYTALTPHDVAVVPFVWARNNVSGASGISNVTVQNLGSLLANGYQNLDVFTGNPADAGNYVFVTGRNGGSGTRITMLAESGFGIGSLIQQYYVASGTWTAFNQNDGWSSGSSVASDLNAASDFPGIGYLGIADANSIPTSRWLTYNGEAYTLNNVTQGKYTFWTVEQLFTTGGNSYAESTFQAQLHTDLDAFLVSAYGASTTPVGIPLSLMNVSRTVDGGQVSHN